MFHTQTGLEHKYVAPVLSQNKVGGSLYRHQSHVINFEPIKLLLLHLLLNSASVEECETVFDELNVTQKNFEPRYMKYVVVEQLCP